MPFSTAGPVSRHRLALGRIPGLEMDNIIVLPGVPGRQFLSSEQYCKAANLEDRQIVNGAILVQTVGWFLEFAPTDEQDVHYKQQFWALVRDETSIDVERLTPNNLEKIYIALQDMRRLFRSRNRSMLDQGNKGNPTEQQMFFINLLDKTRFYFDNKISRFQLRYGLRRDDNFGERLASRVLQWRLRLQNLEALLSSFPTIANDVLPLEQQDENFKNMAEKYAVLFNKETCKTIDHVADDDAVMADEADDDSMKTMGLRLKNLKAVSNYNIHKTSRLEKSIVEVNKKVIEVDKKVTAMEETLNGVHMNLGAMSDDMTKNFDALKKAIEDS